MRDLLHSVIGSLRRAGASYAEARYVDSERENLRVRNHEVEGTLRSRDDGVGIRVLCDGGWGFAAAAGTHPAALETAGARALAIARAAARISKDKVVLAPSAPARGRYASRVARDPFAVPLGEKLAPLFGATRIMTRDARVRAA